MNYIKKLFNISDKIKKPKERVLYAITKGTYLGHSIMFINVKEYPQNGIYATLSFSNKHLDGGMDILDIPELEVINGLKTGIIDKINKVSMGAYILFCKEYYVRKKMKEKNEFIN